MGARLPPLKPLKLLSAAEQVASHLREAIISGKLSGAMPGSVALAGVLGVNHKTVEAALLLLESQGLLEGQGARRRKRILAPEGTQRSQSLRIAILPHNGIDLGMEYMAEIRHRLILAGNSVFFAGKTMSGLGMDVDRIARHAEGVDADAWVLVSASREILEWFATRPAPAFALFGFPRTIGIAGTGPDRGPAYAEAVKTLTGYGHRRIVMLARPQRVTPKPGAPERAFLAALRKEGIATSDYNLPIWENSREGFHRHLGNLFRLTPPTALIVQEPVLFFATRQFLAKQRIRVPEDVSLICADPDPNFVWQDPSIAHIKWDSAPWVRRVVRWAANVSRGKDDRRQAFSKARYVPGGTVGAVRG